MRASTYRFLPFTLVPIAFAFGGACTPSPHVDQFRGPDATRNWFDIRCPVSKADCKRLATERCPGGFTQDDRATKFRGATDAEHAIVVHCTGTPAPVPSESAACAIAPPRPDFCADQENEMRAHSFTPPYE